MKILGAVGLNCQKRLGKFVIETQILQFHGWQNLIENTGVPTAAPKLIDSAVVLRNVLNQLL